MKKNQCENIQSNVEKMPSFLLVLFFSMACGFIVANIYYAQPILEVIGQDIGLEARRSGLIVTLTQIGYALGLLLIVPAADLYNNRYLLLTLLAVESIALILFSLIAAPFYLLVITLLIGLGAVSVQIMVPLVALMTPEHNRGQVIGRVMSGLMLGIMMARPVSSMLTEWFSWRAVFISSAIVMLILAGIVYKVVPNHTPKSATHYGALLASMVKIIRQTAILRRRALYHAALFGVFSLFWTTVPLLLSSDLYDFSQSDIALFALASVTGAIATPLGGKFADKGYSRMTTACAILMVLCAFLLVLIPVNRQLSLINLVIAAIVIDFGVSLNLVVGQRALLVLNPALKNRLNGLYMALFFAGGAVGSLTGVWVYVNYGWYFTALLGAGITFMALLYFATEFLQKTNPIK